MMVNMLKDILSFGKVFFLIFCGFVYACFVIGHEEMGRLNLYIKNMKKILFFVEFSDKFSRKSDKIDYFAKKWKISGN